MPDEIKHQWSCFHFSRSNPNGSDENNVPALLRRVADAIERLGGIEVQDIVFGNMPGPLPGSDLHMTVYYTLADPDDEDDK
jgi:hypothetical protein